MANLLRKNTKIVCTIGPASWEPEVLSEMVEKGMNVARINGAFADEAEIERVGNLIRGVSNKVSLMLDIKGTEVRLNRFGEDFQVAEGDIVEIGSSEDARIYPRTYPTLIDDCTIGDRMLFDDGNVEAELIEKVDGVMKLKVTRGGTFKEGKSINTPGVKLNNPPLTDTDKMQIAAASKAGWEFVAASFIRNAEDAQIVREAMGDSKMQLIAKIENEEGVNNIDEILDIVDGVMVARGDMGVEMPFEKVPFAQKELIYKCNVLGKPVITATQMLESMIKNDRPTRAEITDIANAIIDGSDAIMLSAESSAGKFPATAVETMSRIAAEAAKYVTPFVFEEDETMLENSRTTTAMAKAAAELALSMQDELAAVLVLTRSGLTARLIGRHQIPQPIFALTKNDLSVRQLLLSKGVFDAEAYEGMSAEGMQVEEFLKGAIELAKQKGFITSGQLVLVVGHTSKLTNREYFPNLLEVLKVN